jgi:hypothetical protein
MSATTESTPEFNTAALRWSSSARAATHKASDSALRARRIAAVADHEHSTPVRRDECNAAMSVLLEALHLMTGCRA